MFYSSFSKLKTINDKKMTTSNIISLLRFPLIFCVVIIHSRFSQSDVTGSNDEWPFHLMNFISNRMLLFVNPLFFLISGYLFFLSGNLERKTGWIKKYKKRIYTLLLPYIIWNFIGTVLFLMKFLPVISQYFPGLKNIHLDICLILSCFWGIDLGGNINPIDYPLWFLRDLMIIILFAPLIYFFVKNKYSICGLLLLSIFSIDIIGYTAFVYFSIGAYFSVNKINITIFYDNSKWLFLPLCSVFICLYILWSETFLSPFLCQWYVLNCIVLIFGLVKVKRFHINEKSSFTFFLFVSHGLIIPYIKKLIIQFLPKSSIYLLLDYLLIPLCTLLILWAVYQILSKYTPTLRDFLLGNR